MDITYLGHSSFRIKGKNAVVVTDPYSLEKSGIKFPKHVAADIVTVSHDHSDRSAVREIEGNPYIIQGPGEYEVKGVGVIGMSTGEHTVYRFEIDGVSIVHLGKPDHALTAAQVDALDGVDILMVPVSDGAISVISEIEPSVVLPMMYTSDQLRAFLKEIGKEEVTGQPKLSTTKDKIPEQMQVVVLS